MEKFSEEHMHAIVADKKKVSTELSALLADYAKDIEQGYAKVSSRIEEVKNEIELAKAIYNEIGMAIPGKLTTGEEKFNGLEKASKEGRWEDVEIKATDYGYLYDAKANKQYHNDEKKTTEDNFRSKPRKETASPEAPTPAQKPALAPKPKPAAEPEASVPPKADTPAPAPVKGKLAGERLNPGLLDKVGRAYGGPPKLAKTEKPALSPTEIAANKAKPEWKTLKAKVDQARDDYNQAKVKHSIEELEGKIKRSEAALEGGKLEIELSDYDVDFLKRNAERK